MGLRDGCARLWDRDQPLLQWRCPCGCLGSPALWVSTPDLPSVPATGVPGLSEGPWNPQFGPDLRHRVEALWLTPFWG